MRTLLRSKTVFLLFMALLTGASLSAQNDTLRVRTLDEVVISGSRQEERILDAPRAITVINRDKIENSVYNSVGDLLARQQGIYLVGANQTPGTNQSLFLRGANSNQVAVMIDGVRITDPSSPNNVVDLSELSLTNVERIEIIEGSHSTLFGGAAIGGVVNIITRKNQGTGVHGFVSMQAGGFGNGSGTLSPQADISYSLNNGLYFNGSVFHQNVRGLNASIDTLKGGKAPDKDGFRKTDSYLKAGYRKKGWDAFASYKNTSQRAEIDNGAYQDDDNNYLSFHRDLVNYGVAYQFSPLWKVSAIGSWSGSRRLNENDSSRTDASHFDGNYFKGTYRGNLSTNEIQANFQDKAVKALVGAGSFAETMSFNTFFYSSSFGGFESKTNYDTIKTQATTRYVFGHAQFQGGPDEKLGLTLGGRLSHHSLFGNYGTFEINPSLRVTKSSLVFASASSGFNAPSLYQLFDPTKGFGAYTGRGNKTLTPEKSVSLELGFKKEFESGSYLTASVFHTEVKHSIEYVYLWNKNTAIDQLSFSDYLGDTYINITQQNVTGAEIAGAAVVNSKLSLSGNFTWLEGKLKFSPQNIDLTKTGGNHVQVYSNGAFINQERESNNLVRRPKAMAFAEVRYKLLQAVTLTANYRLAGARMDAAYDPTLGPFGALNQSNVKTYQLIDAGIRWQASKRFTLLAKVENIFSQPYQEIIGFSTRGRSGYIKLNFKF
ncbi:MAG TPA: TonB-dependent receptor, partial [Cyclobacteriaceae bacterium]|nr:TonB-dependent receptor [Cyclobacteriaceae bacterium]